jgi:hypothetical protein
MESSSNSIFSAVDWKQKRNHHPLQIAAIMDDVDIAKMTPTDAAATLRQVATSIAAASAVATRGLGRKKHNAQDEEEEQDDNEQDKVENANLVVVKLLSILEKSVFQKTTKSQRRQTRSNSKNSSSSPLSIYTLVDTLVALAILRKDRVGGKDGDSNKAKSISSSISQQQQEQERYQRLARAVWMQLSSRVVMDTDTTPVRQPPAAAALRQQQQQKQSFPLGPRLSLDCLCAAHTLELLSPPSSSTVSTTNDSSSSSRNNTEDYLYTALCQRLTRGDALSRLSSMNLVKCLQSTLTSVLLSSPKWYKNTFHATRTRDDDDSLSVLQEPATKDSNNSTPLVVRGRSGKEEAEILLLRALSRRFRKGAVRQTMSSRLLLQRVIPCLVTFLGRAKENDSTRGATVDDDNDDQEGKSHTGDADMVWEMQRLTYTLLKDIMARLQISNTAPTAGEKSATTSWLLRNNGTCPDDNDDNNRGQVVTAKEFAWLARACSALGGDNISNVVENGTVSSAASSSTMGLVHHYMSLLHQYQNDGVFWNQSATLDDVDEILQSLQTWKRRAICDGDDDEFAAIVKNLGTILVHRLEHQQQHQTILIGDNNYPIHQHRRVVTSILRNAVLMYRHDPSTMKDYIHAWEMMLLVNDRNNAFWTQCHISELANWIWFAHTAQKCCSFNRSLGLKFGETLLEKQHQEWIVRLSCLSRLGQLLLQPETVAKCTPKLACRVLSSYTAIVSLLPSSTSISTPSEDDGVYADLVNDYKAKETELREILHNLFTRLGEFLLSQRLSPLDVSRAIVAYAKASYVEDMGIFDQLVEVLVTRHLYPKPHQHDQIVPPPPPPLPVRSVAQCLWACGKMTTLDEQHDGNSMTTLLDVAINRIDFDTRGPLLEPPPYLGGARDMAYFLSDHSDALSTKDVAKALWALARLQIQDMSAIVETLLQRIQTVGPHMTAPEVANSLWALSKLRSNTFDAVFILSQRVIHLVNSHDDNDDDINTSVFTPPEAASILYALGRLHLRQEEIFDKLSAIILQQIDSTTALTVANVLWAHRAVFILPPQALLDTWAKKKLGLKAVADEQETQDYYDSSW